MGKLEDWAQDLLGKTKTPKQVLSEMRATYNDCSLSSKTSVVRRLYMDAELKKGQTNTHETFPSTLKLLKERADSLPKDSDCRKVLQRFLASNLHQKFKMKRSYQNKTLCLDDKKASSLFDSMLLLPDDLTNDFRVNRDVTDVCVERSRQARLKKNSAPMVVRNAEEVLERVRGVLSHPEKQTVASLILCLCSASGRRTTEIANGRSVFEPVKDTKYGCRFTGQLKNEKRNSVGYAIPLLVPFSMFRSSLAELRERQGIPRDWDGKSRVGVMLKTNREVSRQYQGNLDDRFKVLFPELRRPHDLRALYCSLVYSGFEDATETTFNLCIMRILGHVSLEESLRYNSVLVKQLKTEFGKLPTTQ